MKSTAASTDIRALLDIMAALRAPDTGCPWDLEQTFETIAPYTIEEAYEVDEAIARGDMADLKDELGDLLLQVVFHARMAEEDGHFSFPDVVEAICDKMVRRHPHVFGDKDAASPGTVKTSWEAIKAMERLAKQTGRAAGAGEDPPAPSALDGVAAALPALMRAEKLQRRAARTGFDWPDRAGVLDKLNEEIAELQDAAASDDSAGIQEEIGDILFCAVNLARHHNVDPETALRRSNGKFATRFKMMEALARQDGTAFADLSLEDKEAYWQVAKARLAERNANGTG